MPTGGEPQEAADAYEIARGGAAGADAALFDAVHPDLRALASHLLRRNERHVSLHTEDLVGEAVMRLLGADALHVESESHLKALAARTMRRVLIDAARRRGTEKRAGPVVTLRTEQDQMPGDVVDMMRLDRALRRLKAIDPARADIVELRYFGGLSVEEIALVQQSSASTVGRSWRSARAWLRDALENDPLDAGERTPR